MTLKVIATGSKGNCYLLQAGGETLVLDAGISFKDIKIGLDFDLSNVVGALVTHSHSDHSKSVKDFIKYGIDVWQPYLDEKYIQEKKFGGFKVKCFDVPHDGCENRGFLIEYKGDKLLYATDFEYIKYSFKKSKINHMLIECNYQSKYVDKDAENTEHVLKGHAELQTTIGIVKDNADSLKTVLLCHISDKNANPIECVAEVKKHVSTSLVDYARAGYEIEL